MQNDILSDDASPALFTTDETVAPIATRVKLPSAAAATRNDGGEDEQQNQREEAKRRNKLKNKADAPLVQRFVNARLLHLKLNLLSKLGLHVPDAELADSNLLFSSVQDEVASLGSNLVPSDVVAIDSAFKDATTDIASRLEREKSCAGAFSAETWHGALRKQVDDYATLLVAHRQVERERDQLRRQCEDLTATVAKLSAQGAQAAVQHHREVAIHRQRLEQLKHPGLTQKLTEEMAMKEAEKSASGAGGAGGKNSSGNMPDLAKLEVAKSLRLQDEVTVLRKATQTLQLALSRTTHQYGTLLTEHENLKSEIREVIAQQDAEESDIRRIFVEREREFDVAMKRIFTLQKQLDAAEKQNARLQKVVSIRGGGEQQQQQPALTREESMALLLKSRKELSSSNLKQQHGVDNEMSMSPRTESLAARMAGVRAKTVPKLQTAYSAAQPALPSTLNELADQSSSQQQQQSSDQQQQQQFTGPPPPPKDDVEDDDDHAKSQRIVNDDNNDDDSVDADSVASSGFISPRARQRMLLSSSASASTDALMIMAAMQEGDDGDDQQQLDPNRGNNNNRRRVARAHASTNTEPAKKVLKITTGTQTFIKVAKPNSAVEAAAAAKQHSDPSQQQNQQNQQQQNRGASASALRGGTGSDTLDKMVRLINKQANIIERFLDESVPNNVALRRKDLARMLKQFGIPSGETSQQQQQQQQQQSSFAESGTAAAAAAAAASSANMISSNNKWHGILHRFPHTQPDLDNDVDEATQRAIAAAATAHLTESSTQTEVSDTERAAAAAAATTTSSRSVTPTRGARMLHNHHHSSSSPSSSPSFVNATPTATTFWNANDAVNALRRVYVDAGRLIDSVEKEQHEIQQQQELNHQQQRNGGNGVAAAAAGAAMQDATLPNESSSSSTSIKGNNNNSVAAVIERLATEQFFAIRSLESSCNLLVQRLGTAKEEFIRKFSDKTQLLNQTLGTVARTHPREANRLSRLAKSVAQARAVVPWMTGVVEHFNSHSVNDAATGRGAATAAVVEQSSPPLCFRASEIILGKVHPGLPVSPSSLNSQR